MARLRALAASEAAWNAEECLDLALLALMRQAETTEAVVRERLELAYRSSSERRR